MKAKDFRISYFVLLGILSALVSSFRSSSVSVRRPLPLRLNVPAGATTTRRYSSSVSTPSSAQTASSSRGPVLLQEILRASGENDLEFLGSLVGWLQDGWKLPTKLPMVYEKQVHEHHEGNNDSRAVITLNSALSPNTAATAVHVDVVAVYPETSGGNLLAMVVVYKEVESTTAYRKLPPMLQNLFKDSEQKILKDFARALADWQTTTRTTSTVPPSIKWDKAKRDMLGELMEDMPNKSKSKSGILDAEIVATDEDDAIGEAPTAEVVGTQPKQSDPSETTNQPATDFAVHAAQRIVEKRKGECFAVEAARRMARDNKRNAQKPETDKTENNAEPAKTASQENVDNNVTVDPRQWPLPSLTKEVLASRSFAQTISRPQDYAKKADKNNSSSRSSKGSISPPIKQTTATKKYSKEIQTNNEPRIESGVTNRKLNVVSKEEMDPKEEEQLRLANEALNEVAQSTEDFSAQEMLEAVMQFGQEKKKEETVGDGFVSGAFEKAKELLKEQHRKREERLQQHVATKVAKSISGIRPNIATEEPITAEEELRRMFEAGEKLAESRIVSAEPKNGGDLTQPTADEQKLIDDLVAANKEISSYARVLDDELVELEVRINESPEGALDGPRQNPLFDIFSGPERYNPNVNPETAVNWPGALPDTKTTTRLPRELNEVVEQAKFAANILSNLKQDGDSYFVGTRKLTEDQVQNMRTVVSEASAIGLISDPMEIMTERSRLQMIIDELWEQPDERFRDIVEEYKDILLSEHFVALVKERLQGMAERDIDALRRDDSSLEKEHEREREILGGLVAYAQLLLKEARALGAELEAQQLEIIRSICKVAMDPSLKSEEETAAALTDTVRDMRPLFDDAFIAYLKYAVAEEEARLARAGVLDDPEHTQWLYVLKIVQQGVYSEIARGISRYVDHIWYILRMETPKERRMLLSEIVDALPTLDVRPFVQVVENIAGALGESARGEFDGAAPLGEMTNKILQLHRDLQVLLPPERIAIMSRDADEWAKRRKEKLLEQRNLTKQRLKAARETEHLEDEIQALGQSGEMERFD
eukprot:scaffold1830_cov148-Amphora_coffeaeformis.AAC.5